jgi:alanine-alpha-ketoisovalerate/valine-pyruvate aminotransferase
MNKLIDRLNEFFRGDAKIVLEDERIQITIGSKTAILSLPELIGGQNEPNKPTD